MNDAPRRCWNVLDKALCGYGLIPTRADPCCYVLNSTQGVSQIETKGALHRRMVQLTSHSNRVRDQKEMPHLRESWIPLKEAQLQTNPWQESYTFFVDDFLGTSVNEMEHRVAGWAKKDFQVGSEDCNGVLSQDKEFVPWRIVMRTKHWGQSRMDDWRIGEDPSRKEHNEDLHCTPTMHTMYRSLLGQINGLQSRSQFQGCYKFSRCASTAASPTLGDVKALNKLARQLKSQPVNRQLWSLTVPLRIISFPDASHRKMKIGLHRAAWPYFSRIATAFFE